MKTTVNLDDEVVRLAKKVAADRGITLTRLIEDALRDAIRMEPAGDYVFGWTTERGCRPPTVDPADRDALYELLDRER